MSSLLYTLIAIPFAGRAGFAIVMAVIILSYPGTFTVIPVFIRNQYGSKYFSSNYGILTLAYVFLNFSLIFNFTFSRRKAPLNNLL